MTNPTPRPALRKADDADVHPAAPAPARSPRIRRTPAAAPAAAEPAPAPAAKKPRKKPGSEFAGATSDHLRPKDAPTAAPPEKAEKAAKQAKKAKKLTGGETVKLTVRVPKNLRKAAEKEAARRGLDVDAVVADLLHAWLTGHR
jgi:hypothetical protein